jgi:RNA polymerase sigma factor (sigma-70 family)
MSAKRGAFRSYSDTELTFHLKEGEKVAFDEIYERYWKKLYNDTYKRLRRVEQVEEIVQDVFTDLWAKRTTKNIENLYGYLLTAVRYQVFMLYKKGKTSPIFEEPLEHLAFDTLQADSLLNVKELKGCIALWLSMQPEKRGEIFRLKYMEDLTTREISEMLGISQKTVQNQLLTSFTSLREFLSKLMILLTLM